MRSKFLTVLAGAVGLAAIVVAAPALSSNNGDICDPISTVFVTVSQPITVTVHDVSINTVQASSSAGALPTTTITRYATVHATTTIPRTKTVHLSRTESTDDAKAAISTPVVYDTTVYKTVTVHQNGQSSSSSTLLAFIVEDGTTFWLGGQTPVPSKSYVVATSVVTMEPINTAVGTSHLTSTVTIRSTRYTTRPSTLTRTLSAFNGTTTQTSGAHVASFFGTGPESVRTSTSWSGWNATSTAGGAIFPTDPAKSSKPVITFITQETVDIYKTTAFSYTASTYTAKGGFNVFTTPSTWSANPSSTSAAEGAWTTAVIDGQTVSWNAHGVTQTCTESSTQAPYTNSTYSATQHVTSADSSSTSSAQSVWTTAVIDGQTVSWSDNGITQTCTESSTHAPYANSSSTTQQISSSTVAGVVTSSADPTVLASATTTSSSSSSKWYIYTPASSAQSSLGVTVSALSGVSSVSSSSISSSSVSSNSVSSKSVSSNSVSSSSVSSSSVSSSARPVLISTVTVVPIPATSASSVSSSQPLGPTSASEVTSRSSSSSVTASSHLGIFPTTSSSTLLTPISISSVGPSTSLQTSNTVSNIATSTSSASSAASSAPSSCGEVGDFILNFDDIPPLSISNDSTFGQQQPIFSPYHHFDFSQGFTVGPPPVDPYMPESKPLLVEFTPTMNTVKQTRPNAYAGTSGTIGNVDHGLTTCFSFNLYGASFGCNSEGPDCNFNFTGYQYDAATQSTQPVHSQQLAVSACPTLKSLDCVLTPVTLDSGFLNIDSVRIDVTVAGVPQIWWMDDLRLGWFNNTCEKGMCRAKAPAHGFAAPIPLKKI